MVVQKSKNLTGAALTGAALGAIYLASAPAASASANEPLIISQRYSSPTATSNALPLLETVPVRGRITEIDGNRVQLKLANDEIRTYRISKARQQQFGLEVGSEVTLNIRRLNNAVTAINPAHSRLPQAGVRVR